MDAQSVVELLRELGRERPIFHSEADLQLAFGLRTQRALPGARVRLETRPWGGGTNWALDVDVTYEGRRTAIEMKYLVKAYDQEVAGERFILKTQSAHDIRRYETVKDLVRVEDLVRNYGFDRGHVVVVSNDPAYWKPPTGRRTLDEAFRLHDEAVLAGPRAWSVGPSAMTTTGTIPGTIKDREEVLNVAGVYEARWVEYSRAPGRNGDFRSLVLSCSAGGGT